MVTRNRNLDKRANWFDRQFVRAQDFVDADDYELDRRRRHVRLLHTPGVAEGLRVTGGPEDTAVSVEAGTAVDTLGREIVVLTPLSSGPLPSGPAHAEIYLVYDEALSDASTDPGVDGFTRIHEIPSIAVRKLGAPDDPVPESPGERPVPGVLLAAVTLDAGKLTAPPDNSVRSTAGAVIGAAALDGVLLRRPDHPTSDFPRITAEAASGDVLFLTGSPPTERMRVSAAGRVGIGTTTPLPGALTVEDASAPLYLRQAGGPVVGGAWRAAVGDSSLRLEANTATAGDFSTAVPLMAFNAATNPATSAQTVTVGPGGNVVLKTRHIYGKSYPDDGDDVLYLNRGSGRNVEVGSDGREVTLLTYGEVASRFFPANDSAQGVAALSLTSRLAGGGTVSWKMYTGTVGGGGAVPLAPAAYEIWHYQNNTGEVRFAIRDNGDTFLNPRGGQLYLGGVLFKTSDATVKTDVEPIVSAMEKLGALRGVSYRSITSSPRASDRGAGPRAIGLIAQDVERVLPELVSRSEQDGHLAVDYLGMTAVLVEAIKDLAARVDRLQPQLTDRREERA